MKETFNIAFVGEVDYGKSSLIGRLLEQAGAIPRGRIEEVQSLCAQSHKDFEPAFLLDSFQEERDEERTIDASYFRFAGAERNYCLIDTPGHREFLKKMVTGASLAHGACLMVDVTRPVTEENLRHCRTLVTLGIKNLIVVLNKMDLAGFAENRVSEMQAQLRPWLSGFENCVWVPLSAKKGINVVRPSLEHMPWYAGPTFLQALDSLGGPKSRALNDHPRFAVQEFYDWDGGWIAGRLMTGQLQVGQEIRVWPSGARGRLAAIRNGKETISHLQTGQAGALKLSGEISAHRGDIIFAGSDNLRSQEKISAQVVWFEDTPPPRFHDLQIRHLTGQAEARVEKTSGDQVELALSPSIALVGTGETLRFILIDDDKVVGAGVVTCSD